MKARELSRILGIATFVSAFALLGATASADPGDIAPLGGSNEYCVSEDGTDGNGNAGACIDGAGLDTGVAAMALTPDGTRLHATGFGGNGVDAGINGNSLSTFDRNLLTGEIEYQQRPKACVSQAGVAPCSSSAAVNAVVGPSGIAISPNGQNIYVTARQSNALSIFDYNALPDPAEIGPLRIKSGGAGCMNSNGSGSCSELRGIGSASDIVISPDGDHVYTAGTNPNIGGITVLNRAADGVLTQKGAVATPPDENVDGCVNNNGNNSCTEGNHVEPLKLAISPDGKNLYAASQGNVGVNDAINIFDILPDGKIVQKAGIDGCISRTSLGGDCDTAPYLRQPTDIAISPDGEYVYVTSDIAANNGETDVGNLYRFSRNQATGRLTDADCFAASSALGCHETHGLYRPYGVEATNEAVYVTSIGRPGGPGGVGAAPAALVTLNRSPLDGELSQKPLDGCFAADTLDQCAEVSTLAGARSIAVAADGDSLYVGGGDPFSSFGAITVFDRNDGTNPGSTIDSGPTGESTSTSATFTFSGNKPNVSFECSLDSTDAWQPCTSPKTYSGLSAGQHTLRVRATDVFDQVDTTPAERSWTVTKEVVIPTCATDPSLCPDDRVDAVVTAAKLQKQKGKTIVVAIKVRANEALAAKLTGSVRKGKRSATFKAVTRSLPAGTTTTVKLRPAKASAGRLVAGALLGSKRAVPKLLITLTDGAMNRLVVKPKIKIQGAPKKR